MLSLEKIQDARRVIKKAIYKTDLIRASKLSNEYELYLKAENLQKTGSFKLRGAYYKISQLTEEEKQKGVIACSAGNHAQGVALSATLNGIKSLICLPAGASISKVESTRNYGAEICLVNGVFDDALARARELEKEHGYTFIHPFDDEDIIAGQGTVGLEILEQLENVDAVVVPIGGGGLIAGVAFAIKAAAPHVQVYGVQAAGAPSMLNSLRDDTIEMLPSVSTIADGIAVKQPGNHTFEYCRRFVNGVVTVTDDEIARAILELIEKEKLIAEGAGATPLAAILAGKLPELKGKRVCCVISGGNIDVTTLSRVIDRGLLMSGRKCTLNVELLDQPGQLDAVLKIIADCRANITAVHHERGAESKSVIGCFVRIDLETRDFKHIATIKNSLKDAGFQLAYEE